MRAVSKGSWKICIVIEVQSVLYVSAANFRHFYQFIQKFYDNNQGDPVIMKHDVK